jgi:EAL and modified HD-GYP domain-containing signal transduction protein
MIEPLNEQLSSVPAAGASFVARQPIYDRALNVYAYELVFREGEADEALPPLAQTLELDQIVGSRLASVKVTRRFVLSEYALLIPAERVALEIDDIDEGEDGDQIGKLRFLAAQGCLIVVDNFDPHTTRPEIVQLAQLVKINIGDLQASEIAERVRAATGSKAKLLADSVDDYDSFERCKQLGFDLFQGSFFRKPKKIEGEEIPSTQLSRLQLVALLQDPDVELEELEAIIGRDVGLSYRLLRYINSGFFYLPQRLTSIHDALVRLGQRQVRLWSTLIVLGEIDDRPRELLVNAIVRARHCELIAGARGSKRDACFTVGLFSLIDAFIDAPLETILATLPFADEITSALIEHGGEYGPILAAALDYEAGRFESAEELAPGVDLRALYFEALEWAEEIRQGLQVMH